MKRACGVMIGAAVALFGTRAGAQYAGNELGDVRLKHFTTPQRFALEFRAIAYKPNIDGAPGVTGTPYASTFGNSYQFMGAAEFDWQALRIPHVGTLGPGISAGYSTMSAPAQFTTCPPAPASCTSGENTSLEVFPLYAVAVLRIDVLMRDFGIPLVPYGKIGAGLSFWRAFNDSGTSSYNGTSGKGYSYGLHYAAGLALSLNWLDPRAAHALDNGTGINNTSLFAEWMVSSLDDFGGKKALYVGTSTFLGGLALEF